MYVAKSENLRVKAAESILDRAGFGAINKSNIQMKSEVSVQTSNMTEDELRRLVVERVGRMKEKKEEEDRMKLEMDAVEVEFDSENDSNHNENREDCSPSEHHYKTNIPGDI